MSPKMEMEICKLNKGKSIREVLYRLELMQQFRNFKLTQKLKFERFYKGIGVHHESAC